MDATTTITVKDWNILNSQTQDYWKNTNFNKSPNFFDQISLFLLKKRCREKEKVLLL